MALPYQQNAEIHKIVIVGDGGTGKTTFVKRHVDGYNNKFVDFATGETVYPMGFRTNLGLKYFNCWDITGLPHDRALEGSHGAIIMFDVNERSTYDHVSILISEIDRVCPGIPILLCGNKVDLQNRNVDARHLAGWLDGSIKYCEISALSNYNFEKPFLLLSWMVVREGWSIRFTEAPPLVPPEVNIDSEAQDRNEQELFGAVRRAQDKAFRISLLIPLLKPVRNELRDRDPDSPLADDDVELMEMVELTMISMNLGSCF